MNANEKKEKKGFGKPAANPSYSQQQRESPQIPFPFSRCRGNTSLIKRVHRNGDALLRELYCIVPGSAKSEILQCVEKYSRY